MSFATNGKYICIEGNIGSGKTSLCQKISERDGCKLILEKFDNNPFLPFFYEDPIRYAFTVELFFLTERQKQMRNEFQERDLFASYFLSDYCMTKCLLFAKNNLAMAEEYELFHKLYHSLTQEFKTPDKIIYLSRSIPAIQYQIRKRGRQYETAISDEYLRNIDELYLQYFQTLEEIPCLIVDCEEVDYVNNEKDFFALYELVHQDFSIGIHHVQIIK